jgi:hypothetical protein
MCATRPRTMARTMGRTSSGRSRIWVAVLVLLVGGALVQACTDNKQASTFPTGQTGHSDTALDVRVVIGLNPNSVEVGRRIGITVLVTNFNGRPLEGRHVQLTTTAERLDQVDGFTDPDGKFVTFLFCDSAGGASIVAFVEGATSQPASATCAGAPTGTTTGTTGTTTTTTPLRPSS